MHRKVVPAAVPPRSGWQFAPDRWFWRPAVAPRRDPGGAQRHRWRRDLVAHAVSVGAAGRLRATRWRLRVDPGARRAPRSHCPQSPAIANGCSADFARNSRGATTAGHRKGHGRMDHEGPRPRAGHRQHLVDEAARSCIGWSAGLAPYGAPGRFARLVVHWAEVIPNVGEHFARTVPLEPLDTSARGTLQRPDGPRDQGQPGAMPGWG